jgi:uncharacterized membrane protein
MDASQNDLEAIRKILAELTARVYRIEHELAVAPKPSDQTRASATVYAEAVRPSATLAESQKPAPPPPPPPRIPARAKTTFPDRRGIDLESRIGSHWLNRIGIAALLIGVSYFLKFAFDNWIGPAGRVSIGILGSSLICGWPRIR